MKLLKKIKLKRFYFILLINSKFLYLLKSYYTEYNINDNQKYRFMAI